MVRWGRRFCLVDLFALVVDVPALDDLGEEGLHDRRESLGVGIGEDVQGRPVSLSELILVSSKDKFWSDRARFSIQRRRKYEGEMQETALLPRIRLRVCSKALAKT